MWFETLSPPLWRHSNDVNIKNLVKQKKLNINYTICHALFYTPVLSLVVFVIAILWYIRYLTTDERTRKNAMKFNYDMFVLIWYLKWRCCQIMYRQSVPQHIADIWCNVYLASPRQLFEQHKNNLSDWYWSWHFDNRNVTRNSIDWQAVCRIPWLWDNSFNGEMCFRETCSFELTRLRKYNFPPTNRCQFWYVIISMKTKECFYYNTPSVCKCW